MKGGIGFSGARMLSAYTLDLIRERFLPVNRQRQQMVD